VDASACALQRYQVGLILSFWQRESLSSATVISGTAMTGQSEKES
jgi:hypothetical protein